MNIINEELEVYYKENEDEYKNEIKNLNEKLKKVIKL